MNCPDYCVKLCAVCSQWILFFVTKIWQKSSCRYQETSSYHLDPNPLQLKHAPPLTSALVGLKLAVPRDLYLRFDSRELTFYFVQQQVIWSIACLTRSSMAWTRVCISVSPCTTNWIVSITTASPPLYRTAVPYFLMQAVPSLSKCWALGLQLS
jgi:hypothetical protein